MISSSRCFRAKNFSIFLVCLAMLPLVAVPAQFVANRACPTKISKFVMIALHRKIYTTLSQWSQRF